MPSSVRAMERESLQCEICRRLVLPDGGPFGPPIRIQPDFVPHTCNECICLGAKRKSRRPYVAGRGVRFGEGSAPSIHG